MKFSKEQFSGAWTELPPEFLSRLDRMFGRVYDVSNFIHLEVRTFGDATAANLEYFLPDGNTTDNNYSYVKTDSSVNTITIYPYGTQSVDATTSYVLSSQGDAVYLAFDKASQTWWPL